MPYEEDRSCRRCSVGLTPGDAVGRARRRSTGTYVEARTVGGLRRRLRHQRRGGDGRPRGAARVEGRQRPVQRRVARRPGRRRRGRRRRQPERARDRRRRGEHPRGAVRRRARDRGAAQGAGRHGRRRSPAAVVGDVVEVTPASIEFVAGDHDIQRRGADRCGSPCARTWTTTRRCGNKQWFDPLSTVHHADMGIDGRERVQRRVARHEVERPEQALRVLRDLLVLIPESPSGGSAETASEQTGGHAISRIRSVISRRRGSSEDGRKPSALPPELLSSCRRSWTAAVARPLPATRTTPPIG